MENSLKLLRFEHLHWKHSLNCPLKPFCISQSRLFIVYFHQSSNSFAMASKAPIRRQFYSVICGEILVVSIYLLAFSLSPHVSNLIYHLPGHFLTASFGANNGWATVNFVDLQKDDTKFPSGPLTLSQATFMMSIAFIPSIIGNVVFPHIAKKFGCKRTLYAMGFPQIVSVEIAKQKQFTHQQIE